MARVGTREFYWEASAAADVTGYRVYVEPETNPVTHNSPHIDVGDTLSVDLGGLANSGFTPLVDADGVYNLGVSALDDMGNESDIAVAASVPLDFVPPLPPTGLGVR